jgi:diguanylate cyclase (GGDEF)-like protein
MPGKTYPPRFSPIRLSVTCGVAAICVGAAVLLGWQFDISQLKTVFPGLVAMAPMTALAMMLSGAALLGLGNARVRAWQAVAFVFPVALLSSLMLAEYLTNKALGIDTLLFDDAVGRLEVRYPGRMAGTTVGLFLLFALVIVAEAAGSRGGIIYRIGASLGLIISSIPVLGYILSTQAFYSSIPYDTIALHTAATFIVLFLGLIVARPEKGWVATVVAPSLGGMMARRFVPIVILVPLLIAVILQRISFYIGIDSGFTLTLVITAVMITLMILMIWNAQAIDRLDQKRRAAELTAITIQETNVRVVAELTQARLDPLTGLAGRALFLDLAKKRRESLAHQPGKTMAILFIDLDGFKQVNDLLGHDRGDEVLRQTAAILRAALRETDIAGRLGGDEFLACIAATEEMINLIAPSVAERIVQGVRSIGDGVGCSIGIAIWPINCADITCAMKRADAAMYEAKRGGKNRHHIYGVRHALDCDCLGNHGG